MVNFGQKSPMTASSPDAFLKFPWDLTSFSAKGSNSKRPGPNQRNTQYYHAGQNDYRYRSEIKSKTIGLYQITDVTDLY